MPPAQTLQTASSVGPRIRAGHAIELSPILSAALDSFDVSGYHGATVRDIARRVGLTVPALYYHHENKEALLFALLDVSINAVDELTRSADEGATDPRQRFEGIVECLVRYTAVSGKLSRLDAEIRSLSAANRHAYGEKRAVIERRLGSTLDDGIERGIFAVEFPRETVRAMLGMIQSITTWYRADGPLSLDALIDRYRAIALRMAGATSA